MHDLISPAPSATRRGPLRAALLGSVALAALAGVPGAFASGGDGGGVGGLGGNSTLSGTGENGGDAISAGGGGGGAGDTGGSGGDSPSASGHANGGSGGQGQGGHGGDGQDVSWSGGGGGGGGGGAHGFNDASGPIPNQEITGGRGGRGGNGTVAGGGGGAGGFGLVLQNGSDYTLTQRATGGAGGDGGNGGQGEGGDGGDGGTGLAAGSAPSLTVRAVMTGGKGGRGGDGHNGSSSGRGGDGGTGVYSKRGSISIEATVVGGDGGDSNHHQGGTGGTGVEAWGAVTVSAEVRGGNSGLGSNGTGGTGIFLRTGADLTINSTVRGGSGSGTGGTAIYGEGTGHEITLQSNAVVSGGLAGGVRGTAMRFSGHSTLNIAGRAVIEGDIVINYGDCPGGSCYMSTLVVNVASEHSFDGSFRGIGTLTKQGSGTLTLSRANDYAGQIIISQGTLALTGLGSIESASSLDLNGTLDISGLSTPGTTIPNLGLNSSGNIVLGSKTLVIDQDYNGDFTGRITGTGSFVKEDGGMLTLRAEQGYSGATVIRAGTLNLTGSGSIASSSAVQVDGTLRISGGPHVIHNLSGSATGSLSFDSNILLNVVQETNGTFAGILQRAATVRKSGAGTLTLTGDSTRLDHSVGRFIGTVEIEEGTLALAGNANIGWSRGMSVEGVLDISGLTAAGTTISNLAGSGTVALGGKSLTIEQTTHGTFSGGFTGTGSFQKIGAGRLTLSGTSTHAGGATIGGGVLELSGSLGSGPVTVRSSGVLDAAGGSIEGAVTVESGGALFGRQNGGTLRMGSLTLAAGSTTNVNLDAPSGDTLFDVTGPLTVNGTLNVTSGGAYGFGVYRIFSTNGTLTDEGLTLGSAPVIGGRATRLDIGERTVDVLVTGDGTALQYWSGNGTNRGGSGTWGSATLWLETTGGPRHWLSGIGVFDGPAGRVTVEGTQPIGTLEFLTSGYELVAGGGKLLLDGGSRLWAEGALTTATVSAPLAGTGSLTKIGAGTIVLAGENSYSGGTLLQAGTLALASNRALGTGRLDASDGTRLSFGADGLNVANDMALSGDLDAEVASGRAATLSGVIGNGLMPGGLVKTGGGRLMLTGDNSYTGGTVISAGTLQIGNGSTSGSILGDIVNNGTLVFDRSDNVTFAGAVSGSGALVKQGTGLLTLTGDNRYTGGTTIAQGTLVGSSSSLAGNITNNAALVFDQAHNGTYSGSISGSGSLTKQGAGTLILTGSSSHAGGTVIEEGTLQIGDGGWTGSISGSIVNNGALVFNRSGTYDFAGSITGTGSLAIVGGTVNFTGSGYAGYTGPVSVATGTFNLTPDSRWGSIFTIGAGGTIGGSGTIGGLIIKQGGTVSPGYSPGTLNVAGNVVFNAGSVYTTEVRATGALDLIAATGTATVLGGTVNVVAARGANAATTTHTILSAQGGITGEFASVTSNLAFLTPSLSYDPNNVYLTVTRNQVAFSALAASPNARAAAAAADRLGFGNDLYEELVLLSADEATAAFHSLSGEVHASAKTALIEDSRFTREAALNRLRTAFDAVGSEQSAAAERTVFGSLSVWGQAFGSWVHTKGDGNAASLSRSTSGFFLGADAPVLDGWRAGVLGGYSNSSFGINRRNSSVDSDNYHVGIYGGTQWGALGFRAGASYTWHDITTARSVGFPGFANNLTANYNPGTTQIFGDLGYRIEAGKFAFEPFANLAHVHLNTGGFAENGGAAALTGRNEDTSTTFTTLGLRAATTFDLGTVSVMARGTLGWRHAFGDDSPSLSLSFFEGGAFSIAGVPIAKDAAFFDVGLDFRISESALLSISYGSQFSRDAVDQSVRGSFSVRF